MFSQKVEEVRESLQLEGIVQQTAFTLLSEPEQVHIFKVVWEDDDQKMRINTGYRVLHNSALGPCKGGL